MKPVSKEFENLALDLSARAAELLTRRGLKVSISESCTGGLLSYHFTANAGASNVLDGAMICYANAIKAQWLGVSEADLARYGAVSAPVVEQMCRGILAQSGADIALATSGIAGSGGGSAEKSVGSVYIALVARGGTYDRDEFVRVELCHFDGDRHAVQIGACRYALSMLLELLEVNAEK